MKITAINKIAFKSHYAGDCGASNPNGTFKKLEFTDTGDNVSSKTAINQAGTGVFEDGDHFVNCIADGIAEDFKNIGGKGLESLTLFLPGSTYDQECIRTPNLLGKDGNGLENIDFSNILSLLRQKGVPINKKCKAPRIFQDSMGIGLCVLDKMVHNALETDNKKYLFPGAKHIVMMTGGGCGIAKIHVKGRGIVDIDGMGSNVVSDAEKPLRVSDIGASVKATLEEFSKYMGISGKDIKGVVDSGVGQLITQNEFTVEKTPAIEKLSRILTNTGKYIIQSTPEHLKFAVKPEFLDQFDTARLEAIKKYSSAIARFIPTRLAEGLHSLILTGPFAFALDDCLKQNYANKDYTSSLPNLINHKLIPYISDNQEYKSMIERYDFKVICDKAFAVGNNTECSELLPFSQTLGEVRNFLTVSLKGFKKTLRAGARL